MQAIISGCSPEEGNDDAVVAFSGSTMGTTYHVKYVAEEGVSVGSVELVSQQALDDVDQRMSTYRPDSELMRFNQLPADSSAKVSADLVELVQVSLYLSRISDGAFDITIGPLVNLWGFGSESHSDQIPSFADIERAKKEIGYTYLKVDSQSNTLHKERSVFVDLSSIAKGYGVDRVAAEIEGLGISNYLVEVGGEVRMKGVKPDGSTWKIGVEKPSLGNRQASIVISADDKGIATSGDYRNYFEVDGKRYSHTIDPRTGYPIDHHLVSVTVIDDSTALADGLATLFMVLGAEKGLELAKREQIAAYFISKTADGFAYHSTQSFKSYVLNKLD